MIRMAFMTDAARVIGASTEEANQARFDRLPASLRSVMDTLYRSPAVVVGRPSLGPWLERTDVKVYLLSERADVPAPAPHIEVVSDAAALAARYAETDDPLLVAGGRTVFQAFLPYVDRLDVAETDELVPVGESSNPPGTRRRRVRERSEAKRSDGRKVWMGERGSPSREADRDSCRAHLVPGDIVFDEWVPRFRLVEETTWDGGRTLRYARRGAGLNNAVSLYMEGIRDGDPDAVHRYTGDRYTQHSTGVPDGQAGFIEFFTDFLARTPQRDIRVLRALEDGRYVFLHVFQSLNGGEAEWVTTDFFDLDDDGRIVEHWDVIAAYADRTPSGHTSIDGATEVTDLDQTDANKRVVRELIEQVLMTGGDQSRIDDLIDERYIQHNAEVADGLAPFKALVTAPDRALIYQDIVLLVGEGNFVATLCKATYDGTPYAQVDIFRLDAGKIVEHWDASEPVPSPEVAKNSGKF